MLQKADFPSGGFVLHKIKIIGSISKFSAWYDAQGNLLAAERIDRKWRSVQPSEQQLVELAKGGSGSHIVSEYKSRA